MKTKIITLFFLISSVFLFSGCDVFKKEMPTYKVSLEIWGPFEDTEQLRGIISNYKEINPFVDRLIYRKMSYETYKQDLLNALATGKGPDIFFISNNWVTGFKDKVYPAPDQIFKEQELRSGFVDTVADDFLVDKNIYGVPLSVDSLALYYNKDLFNAAGIANPPTDWDEFVSSATKLTQIDDNGNILQSGAAMGTAYNINRSTDVLNLIFLQKSTKMTDRDKGDAYFSNPYDDKGMSTHPGEAALKFYTDFSDIRSGQYSWNSQMHNSIDAFVEGKVGMMFNYSWRVTEIKRKNPKLNFAVARVPQFTDGKIASYPSYYGLVVSNNKVYDESDPYRVKKSSQAVSDNDLRAHEAWQFIRFLTMPADGKFTLTNWLAGSQKEFPLDFEPTEEYLKATGRPAARRDIIEKQKDDPFLGPFALENLIAKNWYQVDPESIETIFAEMVDNVNKGNATIKNALSSAANRVTKLKKK